MEELIKDIKKKTPFLRFAQKYLLNKYFITIFLFLIWMVFFDQTSWLVVKDLNKEIDKYQDELAYYKVEYVKNDAFYKKLMRNKNEKEKFARENYFMKKKNEEIFILVVDSTAIKKKEE